MKTRSLMVMVGFALCIQAQTSVDNLHTCEGEGHGFFNKDKYYKFTIAETDQFLVGLD